MQNQTKTTTRIKKSFFNLSSLLLLFFYYLAVEHTLWGPQAIPYSGVIMNIKQDFPLNKLVSDQAYGSSIIIYHLS